MGSLDPRKNVRIGVFIPADSQFLDAACVDIFGTMSYEYLRLGGDNVPTPLLNLAPSVSIFYIGTVQPGQLIDFTSGVKIACTHHLSDPEVQPGKLDIVVVPGPDPSTKFNTPEKEWLVKQAARKETDILSVCTGIILCGQAGILKGKTASGPRGLQSQLRKSFEDVNWVGDDMRWVQDGNLWSCGGITSGNDLVGAYARQSRHFPSPIVELGLKLTEVDTRPQKYETGKTVYTLGLAWQLIRAIFMGTGKPKTA
ncbi:ThiJ/PfpI family protein [Cercophora scortea]|uniref:ThiJ/PfpI family protein n=1 Tax=Cercophora scortea TaxID=314031 RepID=A0AAE0J1X2_9PEZI|nr:ThiJ/PfpI family protein [Cercophora scortea]